MKFGLMADVACQGPIALSDHTCAERFIERVEGQGATLDLLPSMKARGWGVADDGKGPLMACQWCLPAIEAAASGRFLKGSGIAQ